MMISIRGISLIAFTAAAVTVGAPSADASSFLVSQETAPGSGVFIDLGVVDVLPAFTLFNPGTGPTLGTLSEFYDYGPGGLASGLQFNGPRDLVRDRTTTVFLAEGTDGLGLFTVHGLGTRGAAEGQRGAINISYEFNQLANFVLLDGDPSETNANDFYFVDGTQVDASNAFTTQGDDFRAAQRYGRGATDGSIIGDLQETGLEIFVNLEDDIGQELQNADPTLSSNNPQGLPRIRVVGGLTDDIANDGYQTTQEFVLDSSPGLTIRLTQIDAVPLPASLALFGLGLAAAGFFTRRAR